MKFVFASDSFKGTLSSAEIGAMLCESARAAFPDCDCRSVTMADGGEGSVAAVLSAAGGRTTRSAAPSTRSTASRTAAAPSSKRRRPAD